MMFVEAKQLSILSTRTIMQPLTEERVGKSDGFISHLKAAQITALQRAKALFVKVTACRLVCARLLITRRSESCRAH
jgi:hypothetical protein